MSHDDRDLRELFSTVRRDDHRAASEFAHDWRGARRRAVKRPRRGFLFHPLVWTAAGLATMALLSLHLISRDGPDSLEDELAIARELSEWEAPTDAFFEISGVETLAGLPTLEITSFQLPDVPPPEPDDSGSGC